ncbi:peptidyl-prolyl cis-trans isomerase PpiA precursor [Vibrio maritimus]|uniref:peptidylprolyl isomerase n=2 Tax=Vibrio TaxID=662 RepID=A0A090S6K8_9VIBR|nr:peptidyl-prolyl cis-trans isomerase PpiA precursor [Vibrio maritimus]
MARTRDPNSATRQFFINFVDNDFLNYSVTNPGYAVFGKVVEGFDVVQKMGQKPTRSTRGMSDVPLDPIIITKVERLAD